MATRAQVDRGTSGQSRSLTQAIDHWIYVIMALFLIAVILIGFVPDSFKRVAEIGGGGRPDFLWQAHFHALTMASWMALLLTQTSLMATGRKGWHMQLGVLGMVLAPLMVVAGVMLVPANFAARIAFADGGGPEAQIKLAENLRNMTNIALLQLRSGFCFLLLVGLALAMRRRDSGLHKRMIIMATTIPMGAAFGRMPFLYNSQPESPMSTLLWPSLCIAPMFLWDLYRSGSVHRAYWIFLAVSLPTATAVVLLWDTAGWQDFARPLLSP